MNPDAAVAGPFALAFRVALRVVGLGLVLGLAADIGGFQSAAAQQVVVQGVPVSMSGCVRRVESNSCLVVKGTNFSYFDISGISPKPDLSKGVAIALRGVDSGQNTQCGRRLDAIRWSYLKTRCAPASPLKSR